MTLPRLDKNARRQSEDPDRPTSRGSQQKFKFRGDCRVAETQNIIKIKSAVFAAARYPHFNRALPRRATPVGNFIPKGRSSTSRGTHPFVDATPLELEIHGRRTQGSRLRPQPWAK